MDNLIVIAIAKEYEVSYPTVRIRVDKIIEK